VTSFNWGEYAIWHLGPRLRVSIDGRRETVYSERRIVENEAVVAGTPAGLELLAHWRPEYVWLPATSVATRAWLTQHGYRIELETRRSFVAVRGDLQPLASPASSVSLAACFPD
jgi:hypothetical protein